MALHLLGGSEHGRDSSNKMGEFATERCFTAGVDCSGSGSSDLSAQKLTDGRFSAAKYSETLAKGLERGAIRISSAYQSGSSQRWVGSRCLRSNKSREKESEKRREKEPRR